MLKVFGARTPKASQGGNLGTGGMYGLIIISVVVSGVAEALDEQFFLTTSLFPLFLVAKRACSS